MKYRSEIDGLRALAVLPVILFHAGFESFSGGYVGVDVFFVISGYLITTIILNEMEEDKFSLLLFYERRARRILPALFFVMLVSIPFALLWLAPSDLKDYGQSVVSTATFSSNFLFWLERGYFGTAIEFKPLIHTWSLAVEEQYYILFPIFMIITWQLGLKRLLIFLFVIFLISISPNCFSCFVWAFCSFTISKRTLKALAVILLLFSVYLFSLTSRKKFAHPDIFWKILESKFFAFSNAR